jgi:hypothetical protein
LTPTSQGYRYGMQAATLDLLEKASFTPQQARLVAQAIETEVAAHHEHLATKEDLLNVKGELALKIEQVRREIVEARADLIKWIVGMVIGQAVIVLGGVWFLVQHTRP